jgi:FixJ family two-component response regulator
MAQAHSKMEDLTGFELQEQLAARRSASPIVFITSS